MFELKNKSTLSTQKVDEVKRHRAHFHPSERNNGTNSPQKLFMVVPIALTNTPQKLFKVLPTALIIDIYNWGFTLRYVL